MPAPSVPASRRMSSSTTIPAQGRRWGLSRRAWRLIAGGFGLGLLLGLIAFVVLWLDQRNDNEFYRAEGETAQVDGQVFEPLPAPMTGGAQSASGMSEAAERAAQAPRPVEPRPAAPGPESQTRPAVPTQATTSQPHSGQTSSADSRPVVLSRPPLKYPADAQRRGETGKVVVRIDVGSDGIPTDASLISRSGSRALDRAALQAVRQWRFRPAQRDGQTVAGSVEVPIEFTLEGR